MSSPTPTIVYDSFWSFAAERQKIFFHKLEGDLLPWTQDPILQTYRFTNVYRVCDRTTQYLLKEILYDENRDPENLFFRVILFKLFNKKDTWELLKRTLGNISWSTYDAETYEQIFFQAVHTGQKLYSGAYIMPIGASGKGIPKYRVHLRLLEHMMKDKLMQKLMRTSSMEEAFLLLRSYPLLGDFLAYQYLIDLNYSPFFSFSEMDFVVPGPGAKDGIKKCFSDTDGMNDTEIITWVTKHQEEEFQKRHLVFQNLFGRPLQLIDIQNLFCEISKYARVAHPTIAGTQARTRIKRLYHPDHNPISYEFPPKWGLQIQ